MKKLTALVVAFVLLLSVSVFAQSDKAPAPKGDDKNPAADKGTTSKGAAKGTKVTTKASDKAPKAPKAPKKDAKSDDKNPPKTK